MATDITSVNGGDTFIRSSAATTNLDGADFKVGWRADPLTDRAIIKFTLPSSSGIITKVALFVKLQSVDEATSYDIEAHQLTVDFNETEATWNNRTTATAWSSAGGDFSGTIIHTVTGITNVVQFYEWDLMGGSSTNPLTINWGDTVRILLKRSAESGSTITKDFYPKNAVSSTDRPYLEVTYTPSNSFNAITLGIPF